MTRIVTVLDLVDDAALIATYRARHAPGAVWPEVLQDIRDRGYHEMEIWQVADRLVMIADVDEAFPRAGDPALAPIVSAWETEMDVYQSAVVPGGAKWTPMERIFSLADDGTG